MTNCNNRNPNPPCNRGFIKKEKLLKSGKKTKCCYKSKVKTIKKYNTKKVNLDCEKGFEQREKVLSSGKKQIKCYKIKKDYTDCSNRNPTPPCEKGFYERYNHVKKQNCCYKTKKNIIKKSGINKSRHILVPDINYSMWDTRVDPTTDKTFYHNVMTGESYWAIPPEGRPLLKIKPNSELIITIKSLVPDEVKELSFKIMPFTKIEKMLAIYAKENNTTIDNLGFFTTNNKNNIPLHEKLYDKNPKKIGFKKKETMFAFVKRPLPKKINTPNKSNTKSYLPSIYEKYNIKSLSSTEPDPDVFNCEKNDAIQIQNKEYNQWECHNWDSPSAQKAMLKNLHTKAKSQCSEIITPNQRNANCWFNSFVMIFFISDKGRKFFRILRETMITGKLPDGTELNENLKKPFFIMNKFIDSFLLGTNNKLNYANRVDTNEFIDKISKYYKLLPPDEQYDYSVHTGVENKKTKRWESMFYEVDQPGNPYIYYKSLLKLIGFEPFSMLGITGENPKEFNKHIEWYVSNYEKLPHIIVAEYHDTPYYRKKRKSYNIPIEFEYKDAKWVLDSASLRDTYRQHFSSYVTCNGESYLFDGGALNKFYPHDWKKYINTNQKWKTGPELSEIFSFSNGYQLLFYYRA